MENVTASPGGGLLSARNDPKNAKVVHVGETTLSSKAAKDKER